MTYLDLTTIHYLKVNKKKALDNVDLTNLIYVVAAIRRQPARMWDIISNDSKTIIRNIQKTSKKYTFLMEFLNNIKIKFKLNELEMIAFICWYTFFHLDFKSFQKNSIENISDKIIDDFHDWYKLLNSNVHIIFGFKKSCKTIMDMRLPHGESSVDCLNRLIAQDKISEIYYTGGVTSYFLAAIPKRQIHIPKSAIFSNKLFSLVNENRDMLISKLNLACKNYLKVPIDSVKYLSALQHVDC